MSTLMAALVGAGVFAAVWWALPRLFKQTGSNQQAIAQPVKSEAATAVFMETRMAGLPIGIPSGGVLHLVSLNKRRITSKNAVN